MKNIKKTIIALCSAAFLASGFLLTGCSNDNAPQSSSPQSVSMALGIHDYFPLIPMTMESIYTKIYDACYSWGDFSAVVVDGDPFVACNYSMKEPDKHIDEAKRKQLAKKSTEQILSEVSAAKAQTPEIDTLSAITLSAQALKGSGASKKTMLVADSGLSTASLLNFSSQNILDAPADAIVEQLESLHAVPDVSDIDDIIWIGLGTTCGEQDKLTSDDKYKLQVLWEAILSAGGAASVTFDASPVSNEEYAGDLPECTVVPIIADSLEVAEAAQEDDLPEIIKFDTSVKFKGDLSEFIDENAAVETFAPIAEYLTRNPDVQIYLAGMTATQWLASGKELSMDRANACKTVLVNSGVDESQLICVGLGHMANPLRVNDVDAQGNLIEEMAQLNRAVFFIRSDSSLVSTILQCSEVS